MDGMITKGNKAKVDPLPPVTGKHMAFEGGLDQEKRNHLGTDQIGFSGLGRDQRFRFSHKFFRLIPRISAICSSEWSF